MKRVLLDCDGVLSDFIGGALAIVNQMFGTRFIASDVTEFDFTAALGMSPANAAAVKRAIGSAPNFAANLHPLPGAVAGFARLEAIADVYIVTSPWNSNPTWCHDRESWLLKHFGVHHGRVIHASPKHLVCGDVLVDDKTSTLDAWRAAWPGRVAVQWSTPHNRRDLWDGPSTSSWDFLIDEIVGRLA